MIELKQDQLDFSFPEVHPGARLRIQFQRTLRIPDDDRDYLLPPGLGAFRLRHVDDYASRVPRRWLEHGGVMLPMYQSEAMWLFFSPARITWTPYPFAIKVAAGKIDAVNGQPWSNDLGRRPQNYMVTPGQPWLDGFCVEKGVIRQFVAMPLGAGYSAEEQLTGAAEHGGLQILVCPMKREVFERRFPERERQRLRDSMRMAATESALGLSPDMGLAPGGRMKQQIYSDPFDLEDWDVEHRSRCFVHIANSLVWRAITGEHPPVPPPTAKQYTEAGLPWFDYYRDAEVVGGGSLLERLKSVVAIGKEKGDVPLPENEPVDPDRIVKLRDGLKPDEVRVGEF
jgi:hypothetical protein